MSNTKNLGQVAGLFIGLSAPENTTLVWYDSTPNQQCHKVYDVAKKMWVALDPQIVAQTTYSELVNNAKKNGSKKGLSTKEIAIRLSARQEPAASATSLGPNLLIRGPTVGSAQTEPTPIAKSILPN